MTNSRKQPHIETDSTCAFINNSRIAEQELQRAAAGDAAGFEISQLPRPRLSVSLSVGAPPSDAVKTLQTIYDNSGKRRVIIFQRDDGSFGFDAEHLSDELLEMAWLPSRFDSHCDTAERALAEARGRVQWLAETA